MFSALANHQKPLFLDLTKRPGTSKATRSIHTNKARGFQHSGNKTLSSNAIYGVNKYVVLQHEINAILNSKKQTLKVGECAELSVAAQFSWRILKKANTYATFPTNCLPGGSCPASVQMFKPGAVRWSHNLLAYHRAFDFFNYPKGFLSD